MVNRSNTLPSESEAAELQRLVAALPEIYQPIYQHPEHSAQVSRICEDRLVYIKKIYKLLEMKRGRPLHVLDLGCAQGFFSLSLAELGATVVGVDFLQPNIDVCNALATAHPGHKVNFYVGRVENIIEIIEAGQFDLVLGLSVFHHIVHVRGLEFTQKLLASLAVKTSTGIYEMALPTEPPDWAMSQPANPRSLLGSYAFVHEMAQMKTHLSDITRPLYIASNHYWFLNDSVGAFESFRDESHAFAANGAQKTRHYYFSHGVIAKLSTLDIEACKKANLNDYCNEVYFLLSAPPDLKAPKLILNGHHDNEVWIVREHVPGNLLCDLIHFGTPYDADTVVLDILEQLKIMEAAGFYHDDLRTWNTVIRPDGHATLIDYGAISINPNDCAWPHNIFLCFMMFVHETVHRRADQPSPIRKCTFNPDDFAEPYRSTFWEMLQTDYNGWSFAKLHDRLLGAKNGHNEICPIPVNGLALAMQAAEVGCRIYQDEKKKT